MLGSTLGLLVSGVVAIIDLFLMFAIDRVFNPFAESPCSAATFRRHEAEKCRSVSRKWKGAVLHHLCFPLQGVWAKLPQSLTNALLPFLATNGTPHIRWLWDGCVAPWDFPYSAPL